VLSRNSDGLLLTVGDKQMWDWENKLFLDLCVNILKTVRDTSKVTIND